MTHSPLPVVVIGAGPVGLAAAVHLQDRGETPLVLEAGAAAGAAVLKWGHVQLFSPWEFNIDPLAATLLEATGWTLPDPTAYPTGAELVERYLAPLAAHPAIAPHLRFGTRVRAVTRQGFDKMKTTGRDDAPYAVFVEDAAGDEHVILAKAVIDASGTYHMPNPLGAHGVPALGERGLADRIVYGIPAARGTDRARYAGRHTLVVGSGHSAFNVLQDLTALADEDPATQITWLVRRPVVSDSLYGGGANDQLAARGALGRTIERLVKAGRVQLVTGFKIDRLSRAGDQVVLSDGERTVGPVDQIVATTGFRPDLSILAELRLSLDPAVESPAVLAPLIDPNEHSCGTVRPHGAEELRHPDSGLYIVGMKSYGRAPTFLMRTGYEQVRSVVAAIVGDWESARRVELVLPETGVCSGPASGASAGGCCGTAPAAAAPTFVNTLDLISVGAAPTSGTQGSCCG
jgi:thioredoxin reductase